MIKEDSFSTAGVKVALQQIPPDSYFNPSLQYLKLAFGESQWPVFSLKFFYLQALAANAPYNETHWHDPAWNTLLFKAIGELDAAKAQSDWSQVQQIQCVLHGLTTRKGDTVDEVGPVRCCYFIHFSIRKSDARRLIRPGSTRLRSRGGGAPGHVRFAQPGASLHG